MSKKASIQDCRMGNIYDFIIGLYDGEFNVGNKGEYEITDKLAVRCVNVESLNIQIYSAGIDS